MQIQPYLFFDGRCEEAIGFYRQALGAELTQLMRMKDSPDPPPPGMLPPGSDERIMHASLQIGDTVLMVSDGSCRGHTAFQGFSLSLTLADADRAAHLFTALGEGGKVEMPLEPTFFSPCFGMVEDRFGVLWMIHVAAA